MAPGWAAGAGGLEEWLVGGDVQVGVIKTD